MPNDSPSFPRTTYRVQLHAGFTLNHLTEKVPYLHALGISDVYCPPIFQATDGSKHGYDVCDYDRVSAELGGDKALARLSTALRKRGMGLLLDFVPNHMGIDASRNHWWREVLEHGRNSRYADFFDIRWEASNAAKHAYVVLPLLPSHYGCLLQEGKLSLVRDGGSLVIACDALRFPLRPGSYAEILNEAEREDLKSLASAFADIEADKDKLRGDRQVREFDVLRKRLGEVLAGNGAASAHLDEFIARLNGSVGDHSSFDHLDELISAQHYRLARWQAGAHGVNYRRFFAINTLMGLRMEDERVFARAHEQLARLIREGVITGVRIDHVDGLRDPQVYLERLKALAEVNRPQGAPPIYLVVEKILGAEELLPTTWAVHGTTGYDFIPEIGGLLTAKENERVFDDVYREFTGDSHGFLAEMGTTKKRVLDELFPSTVLMLAEELHRLIQGDRRWRDLTVPELSSAISALVIGLSIYRTYRRSGETLRPEDHREITRSLVAALRNNPRIESELVIFVSCVWLGDYPEKGAPEKHREALTQWVLSLQQYTGAVMAKAVEDTAFYTYNRLIGLNEVGGFPREFGTDFHAFHEACAARQKFRPSSMLATSTHDTKVSEDVRARLLALSEMPEQWRGWLTEWREINAVHKTELDGKKAPDAQEEYRLYQTLLGAWPLAGDAPTNEFKARMGDYFEKAINEAKVNTTQAHPAEDWIAACRQFSEAILSEETGAAFLANFRPAALKVAEAGMINSLTQVLLKLTVPGVPDIYQGNEAWTDSLVDPDNRRNVNFDGLEKLSSQTLGSPLTALLANWKTGGVKLELTRRVLLFRREWAELFEKGVYIPLQVEGALKNHVIAFARDHGGARLVVVAPCRVARLKNPPCGDLWGDTRVMIGAHLAGRENVLSGGLLPGTAEGEIYLEDLLADFPLGLIFTPSFNRATDASEAQEAAAQNG